MMISIVPVCEAGFRREEPTATNCGRRRCGGYCPCASTALRDPCTVAVLMAVARGKAPVGAPWGRGALISS